LKYRKGCKLQAMYDRAADPGRFLIKNKKPTELQVEESAN
jgi:hypothetical protein